MVVKDRLVNSDHDLIPANAGLRLELEMCVDVLNQHFDPATSDGVTREHAERAVRNIGRILGIPATLSTRGPLSCEQFGRVIEEVG